MMIAQATLAATAAALTAPGKGLLAADESVGTIEKRFTAVAVANTEANRRAYRELLFTAPGLGQFLGGAILFEETLKQKSTAGMPLPDLLNAQGIVPGIKVDQGTVPIPGLTGETITQGLDGLAQRLAQYKTLGARFAKWRAVLAIGNGMPSAQAIASNAQALAAYAAICQAQDVLPIVEPEVLMDGDQGIAISAHVTEAVLHAVFHALQQQGVCLEYMILKPNMVEPGHASGQRASPQEVAHATLTCLRRTVPAAVPGICFLSGGQSETTATENLQAMNASSHKQPWVLSFSYGRALQASALATWRGLAEHTTAAHQALLKRARLNSAAAQGLYTIAMENA